MREAVQRYLLRVSAALVIVSFCLGVMGAWVTPIAAIEAKPAPTRPKGLTLSPLRREIQITPGTSLDGTLTVTNSTDKAMVVSLDAEEFSVTNRHYDYAFTSESDLVKWVKFTPEEVTLMPGQSKKVAFRVGVPLSAEPGGRYISLFAATDAEAQDGGVRSRQRIASLVYLTVLGDVKRDGHLLSLSSPWAISGDSLWSMALQNTGTTHFRSRYTVSVQNVLGHKEVAHASGDALILPGTVRAVVDELPLPLLPGLYKVVYTIGLGDMPAAVETRLVLYLPPAAFACFAAAIGGLVWIVVRRRSTRR